MPRRDGQPTEQEIADQRAGHGPAPTISGRGAPVAQATAAALAATAATADRARQAPVIVAPALTVAAIGTAAAGILGAFDNFLNVRRDSQRDYLNGLLEAEVPEVTPALRLSVINGEVDAEKASASKLRARLARDLPKALSIVDPVIREAQVQKILARERRYVTQRESAQAGRALGIAEQRQVEIDSPEGGYWKLSDHVQTHTLDCLAMGGKVWPHSVLRTYHPPLHGECPCEIWTIDRARQAGLVQPDSFATADQSLYAMQIAEADIDDDEFADELALLEVAWDQHWGAGTTKAGQFKPKRGGDPGAVLRRRRLHRSHMHDLGTPEPVAALDHQLDVRDLRVSDLREGDQVMVNGTPERITQLHPASPGLLTLEHSGLVHIDRDTARGIPGPNHPSTAAVPDLPEAGADDRFELRHGPGGTILMHDRQSNTPYAAWTDNPDMDSVRKTLDDHNRQARAEMAAREPAPPSPTGGPSHADVLKVARMRKPAAAIQVAPGIHYQPGAGGLTGGLGNQPDGLKVGDDFFGSGDKYDRGQRLFRSFGKTLTEGLGDHGMAHLAARHPLLRSPRAVIDTYASLAHHGPGRIAVVHPDAARAIAAAAVERGLPIHPESAKLARRPTAVDSRPTEHPVHELAASVLGLHSAEGRDVLQTAGYQFAASTPDTITYRNHEAGAAIMVNHDADHISLATAAISPPPDAGERAALVGQDTAAARDHLVNAGYAPNYTSSGDWLSFVHPAGRGAALKVEHRGGGAHAVTDVRGFTPTDRETRDAGEVVYRADPLKAIKAGDDFEQIRTILDHPVSQWQMTESGREGDDVGGQTVGSLPAGVQGYAKFGRGDDAIVVHYAGDSGSGKRTIVAAGLADPTGEHPGRIVSASEHSTLVQAAQQARDEKTRQQQAASQSAGDAIRAAVDAADGDALKKALGGVSVNAAGRLLKAEGFEYRTRRRSRAGGQYQMTYTFRGPNATTIKVTGPLGFAELPLSKVVVVGNPQGGARTRLPKGTAPTSLAEVLTDTLGRADELGARFDAGVHVTGVVEGGVSSGAAAHHEFNGTIAIRKSGEAKDIRAYLKARNAGDDLSDDQHLNFYNHLETLQHEVNHGVGKRGDEQGGLAFGPKHYRGLGKNVEEALTEETAHVLTVDWLRSHDMTDVLGAVKRHPFDRRVQGVYQNYRVQLRRILDDANVPESDRRDMLERMKFRMSPEERNAEIMRLAGADNLAHALHGEPERRVGMQRNFAAILRPDLSDIDVTQDTTLPSGRVLHIGDTVTVTLPTGRTITGPVIAIDSSMKMVQVQGEDGLTLWHHYDRFQEG